MSTSRNTRIGRRNTHKPCVYAQTDFGDDFNESTTAGFLDDYHWPYNPAPNTKNEKKTPSVQTSVCPLHAIRALADDRLTSLVCLQVPDIAHHHGKRGLKNICDYIRGSLDGDELVMNSYSSILTGVEGVSAAGLVRTEIPSVICDLCGKHFHARGMSMHKIACVKKKRHGTPM